MLSRRALALLAPLPIIGGILAGCSSSVSSSAAQPSRPAGTSSPALPTSGVASPTASPWVSPSPTLPSAPVANGIVCVAGGATGFESFNGSGPSGITAMPNGSLRFASGTSGSELGPTAPITSERATLHEIVLIRNPKGGFLVTWQPGSDGSGVPTMFIEIKPGGELSYGEQGQWTTPVGTLGNGPVGIETDRNNIEWDVRIRQGGKLIASFPFQVYIGAASSITLTDPQGDKSNSVYVSRWRMEGAEPPAPDAACVIPRGFDGGVSSADLKLSGAFAAAASDPGFH